MNKTACPYCVKKNPKNLIKNSEGSKIILHYDNDHGWRIYTTIKDFVASNYSDEDIYHHCFSDKIEFCPICQRKLV